MRRHKLTQKQIQERNRRNRILYSFIGDIARKAGEGVLNSMHEVAQYGLRKMLTEAHFNDYTGILVNSYQAAVMEKGRFKIGGSFVEAPNRYGESVVQVNRAPTKGLRQSAFYGPDGAQLYTSYNQQGTSRISFASVGRKQQKIAVRKVRTSSYAKEIPYRKNDIRRTRSTFPDGYGRDLTVIRTANTDVRNGTYVVFANPTPYASKVHNEFRAGRERHKVFPTSNPVNGAFLRATAEKNMKRSMAYVMGKYGK